MHRTHLSIGIEISYGARDSQHTVIRTRGEPEPFGSGGYQLTSTSCYTAMRIQPPRRELGVASNRSARIASALAGPSTLHTVPHRGRTFYGSVGFPQLSYS